MQEVAVNHEFKKQQLHCKNEHWDLTGKLIANKLFISKC